MMHIAMYKGPAQGWLHRLSHWAVSMWTRSQYSHCELVFDGLAPPNSYCASASARSGAVRFTRINLDSGRWDVYELKGFDEVYARRWFCSEAVAAALGLPRPHKWTPADLHKWALDAVMKA